MAGMDERAVADLRELDRRDAALRDEADRLRSIDRDLAELRARAEAIDAFFVEYPDVESRLRQAIADARAELERRRAEVAEAQRQLEQAGDEEGRLLAQRALERANDHVAVADARLARAQAEHDELEREAEALPQELPELEARARRGADELQDVPAPGEGPRGLIDWSSRAHAAIFVATGQLDVQRDLLIREANELATALLGEPTYGSTPAQVRARVEAQI
jgi:seryl-tRNA synthetase